MPLPPPARPAGVAVGTPLRAAPPAALTFLGRRITPLTRRRLDNFRANRRGFWSLWIFLAIFGVTLIAEVIANDRPLLIRFDGAYYVPVLHNYPETMFGGFFPSEAKYSDPDVQKLIEEK